MKSYNVKCLGCGATLNDNPNQLGYVINFQPQKTKYCYRCFNLIHYKKIDDSNLSLQEIKTNFLKLDFNNNKLYIFHIVDVLNLDKSLILDLLKYQDNLCFVVNKMDCFPKRYNTQLTNELIIKTITSYGFNNPCILYTSKNNNSSIKRLYQKVISVNKQKLKAIFVGYTNVGKSSLINALHKINDSKQELTISPFVNTTVDVVKTKIDKYEIIDTPGLCTSTNIMNYLAYANIKKLSNYKNSKQINFYINPDQALMFSGLGYLAYMQGQKANFTFYFSSEVNIKRVKPVNADKNLTSISNNPNEITYLDNAETEFVEHEYNLDPEKKHNISIDGLGLISLNQGIKLIKIKVRKDVGVSLNKYAII